MKIITVQPDQRLNAVVKNFWFSSTGDSEKLAGTYRIIADGAPGMIFQHDNGHSAVLGPAGSPLPVSFVYGQGTGFCLNEIIGKPFVVGVNLQPAALKGVFSIDSFELTDKLVSTEVFFTRSLEEQLINTHDPYEIIDIFTARLLHLQQRSGFDKTIEHSVRLIGAKPAEISSGFLADKANICTRQLQRRFRQHVGVSPEHYIRIVKFQQSLLRIKNRQFRKLNDVALSMNYTDQSHFGKEFRQFTGLSPKAFAKSAQLAAPADHHTAADSLRIFKCLN
ncbi:AraC family transcriptional regulator [Pedobacter sp. SYP-B3415]|uniref:helix-turn-helix domain-containing protein n=1 Tax=Pedobacter sp. SYP-B3415 TaxID=2496641 RepID=UPI00101DAC1D|nr:helix-turn-helix domain-containing protein [Pedobacter sp. SYP-B3415]